MPLLRPAKKSKPRKKGSKARPRRRAAPKRTRTAPVVLHHYTRPHYAYPDWLYRPAWGYPYPSPPPPPLQQQQIVRPFQQAPQVVMPAATHGSGARFGEPLRRRAAAGGVRFRGGSFAASGTSANPIVIT